MNLILLKNILQEELKKYNYILGSRLLSIHLANLANKYSNDSHFLLKFNKFLLSMSDELENIKNGFNILNEINNINIIIELLYFFNPSQYYNIKIN